MDVFEIGDRVRYLGIPYFSYPAGTEGVIVSFGSGASGAEYAHVYLDGYPDDYVTFVINGQGPAYVGPEIERI